jgi:hemerythrin-like metal-binding protein
MKWSNALMVGHPTIDRDHQKLVDLLNRLYEAMQSGKGTKVCDQVLSELIAYTKSHFATEEQLMAASQYPKFREHKAMHTQLVNDVMDFKSRLDGGSTTLSVSLFKFLKDWLANHILASDRDLVAALKARSASQAC